MTNNQPPAYSLDDTTLERAAEAAWENLPPAGYGSWNSLLSVVRQDHVDFLRAALPVLGAAIERALLERMIADAESHDWFLGRYEGWGYDEDGQVNEWLRTYLPAAEERESGGAR